MMLNDNGNENHSHLWGRVRLPGSGIAGFPLREFAPLPIKIYIPIPRTDMKYLLLLLLLVPANVGCASLPLDGSALGALKSDQEEACNCEVQVTCN